MEIGKLIVSSEAIGKATASVKKFIDSICDKSSFVETDAFVTGKTFEDAAAALGEGVVTGYATLGGKPVHIFAQNAEVLKGSLGKAHADKIVKCMRRAVKTGTPLISVIDCGGARVGEGVGVLEGYAEVLAEAAIVSGQVPHFCVVKGNAVGMMSAFVAMADFAFMSKDAVLSLDSPMYLASTQKEFPALNKLLGYDAHKGGADIAQFSYKSEADLKKQLTALTDLLLGEVETKDDPNRVASALDKGLPASDAVKAIVDDGKVVEYCSDWAKDVVCALASVNGIAVGVVATDSSVGKGYISLDGARKIAAFVDKLEAYDMPLITLVDSLGFNTTVEQEKAGAAKVAAELFVAIASSSIDKIGVATGKAVGAAYSALMSKGIGFDYTLATDKACVSPIAPDAAVDVLMADQLSAEKGKDLSKARAKLADSYAKLAADPMIAAQEGYVDNVVEAKNLRPYIASALLMLKGI